MSGTCSAETLTCQIWTKGGKLPNPDRIAAQLEAMHSGYSLRGIEMCASGRCMFDKGKWVFELDKTHEQVALQQLGKKIQKHQTSNLLWKSTSSENAAFANLKSLWRGRPISMIVIGVLTQKTTKSMPVLSVSKIKTTVLTPIKLESSHQENNTVEN